MDGEDKTIRHAVHQPTYVSVDQEILKAALWCVEVGLEHLRGMLAEHDNEDTVETLKRKTWRARIASDISKLIESERSLRKCLGWPEK